MSSNPFDIEDQRQGARSNNVNQGAPHSSMDHKGTYALREPPVQQFGDVAPPPYASTSGNGGRQYDNPYAYAYPPAGQPAYIVQGYPVAPGQVPQGYPNGPVPGVPFTAGRPAGPVVYVQQDKQSGLLAFMYGMLFLGLCFPLCWFAGLCFIRHRDPRVKRVAMLQVALLVVYTVIFIIAVSVSR
eukprot:GILK01013209.1.p1 GENE.GILK01013209.1~~GILK01013209.1.p1  ORF type:complete len:185 (-),score=14.34 GILK01013209.1:200-754(-)